MPTDDRDQQFERALARHLRNASPDSACPDAETLAAYHERTLPLEEMAGLKEHIAGCARCQESLALVEQSGNLPAEEWELGEVSQTPEEMAIPKTLRAARNIPQSEVALSGAAAAVTAKPYQTVSTRPPWRWIVPVGALAAGVIVWVGVREIRTQHIQQMENAQMAESRPTPPQLPQSRYEPSEPLRKEEPAKPSPQKVSPERAASRATLTPSPSGIDLALSEKKDAGRAKEGERVTAQLAAPTVSGDVGKSRAMDALPRPLAGAPATAGPGANRQADKKKEELAGSVTDSVAVASASPALNAASVQVAAMQGGNVAELRKLATTDRRYILAPGEKQAWRLGDAGTIERSTDRGKTWKPEQSGVTADLTAGSAPSDQVCWVVGKRGTLLLTTDGGIHWKLLSSPITEDLGGIHAIDAMQASIWDVPNRKSFETSDGGATWTPTTNE